MTHWSVTPRIDLPPPPPPVLIDLSPAPEPVPLGPEAAKSPDVALAPEPPPPPEPEPPPPKPVPLPSAPDVAVPLPVKPPPPPRPKPAVRRAPRVEPAAPAAAAPAVPAPPPAAPPDRPAPSSNAVPIWQSLLTARLQQAKRYPNDARVNSEQGVAYLRVALNRAGGVLSARIERSSGFASLDNETLALAQRASPLPPPPPEVPGDPVVLVIPVRFTLQ